MNLPLFVSADTLAKWKKVLEVIKYLPMEPGARVAMNKILDDLNMGLTGAGLGDIRVYGEQDLYLIVKTKGDQHLIPDDRARVPIYKTKNMAEQAQEQNGYTGAEFKICPCKTIYIL